jgi:acetylornithine deacetylase/succinyl-diaminopimelate desuccinylase-like protein
MSPVSESVEVLQTLIRFDTVNPPGNERPAIEYLENYVAAAGFETQVLGCVDERPNLIATLDSGVAGPVFVFLGHVDTVLAAPDEWEHGPWSGDVADGYLWGRGSLDMKSQVACEAVAAVDLARKGWRPARGALKLVFVSDEETGGDVGARWLTEQHPDLVRCDYLLNEGAGAALEAAGIRRYGVCCGEKGIFRFKLTAHGVAGHASLPRTGDNALLKLAPVLAALGGPQPSYAMTEAPTELIRSLGGDPSDPAAWLAAVATISDRLPIMIEPMFGVTLTPTMIHASDKINVIPSRAYIKVDCRVPPGLGADVATAALNEVLGPLADDLEVEFTEQTYGYASPSSSPLMDALKKWVMDTDPGADTLPVLLPGFSDSSWFRRAFPELIAYGFFPQRYQPLAETAALVHNANERIDVRDLELATGCYAEMAVALLG